MAAADVAAIAAAVRLETALSSLDQIASLISPYFSAPLALVSRRDTLELMQCGLVNHSEYAWDLYE
jgi:hypothetical protein